VISRQARPIYQASLLIVMLISLITIWSSDDDASGRLSGMIYDSLLSPSALALDNRVVVIDIDEESLQKIGRWPWPRVTQAKLLEQLQRQQPAIIGLDILFPEPDNNPASDQELKHQLSQPNVISAVTFSQPEVNPSRNKADPAWPISDTMIALAPTLLDTEKSSLGHINPTYDADNVIRRIHPVICADNCIKTLSIAMLERLTSLTAEWKPSTSYIANSQLCIGPYCQYVDDNQHIWIPYQYSHIVDAIPAWKVLSGESIPNLRGTLTLIGTSAVGLGDNVITPLSPETPGVNIHALLLSSWLDSVSWQPLPHQTLWQSLALLLITFVFLVGAYAQKAIHQILIIVISIAVVVTVGSTLFRAGIWATPLPLIITITAQLALMAIAYGVRNHLERLQLENAFNTYVPPFILQQLIKGRQDHDALAPKRTEITVLFADIKGFTHLCEKLQPEQIAEMTNHLFTELTEEIHRHNGTLDKYMGDCIMAFWGAPLSQPSHKELALNCALALQQRTDELADWLTRHNLPPVQLSIALETGDVTVGNMGSRQRRAYTALGHPVNLAAHLQGMSNILKHNILIGPQLTSQLPATSYTTLGELEIKGITGKQNISTPKHSIHAKAKHSTNKTKLTTDT